MNEGHQTCKENVDSGQGNNRAKIERSRFNSVREKARLKCFSNKEIRQLSHLNMYAKKKKKKVYS